MLIIERPRMPTEIMVRVRGGTNSKKVARVVRRIKRRMEFVEIKDVGSEYDLYPDYWTFVYLTSLDLIPASRKMKKIVKIVGIENAEISLG